jgi:MFS family permease
VWSYIPRLITAYGEKAVFITASILGVVGSLLQMTAVLVTTGTIELVLVLLGASIQSFTYVSSNNLRFAVAYFTKDDIDFLPKATSFVLLGGVLSAFLGPLLSNVTRYLFPGADFAGSFLQIAIMYFLFGVLAWFTDFQLPPSKRTRDEVDETLNMLLITEDEKQDDDSNEKERELVEILKQTNLALLVLFQCLSYNVMALFMGQIQFPILDAGYSTNGVTYTITAHMVGMFLPGLFSGHFVKWFGTWVTGFFGFAISLIASILFMIYPHSLTVFIIGMSLVGLGWNLSFVGPSSEVSKIYRNAEKYKVVGFNDGIMLMTIGVFNLAGSSIYYAVGGWVVFNYVLMGTSTFSALLAGICGVRARKK